MRFEAPIVDRREQQARSVRSPIGIVQDGKARKVNVPAADECNVWTSTSGGEVFTVDVVTDRTQQLAKSGLFVRPDRREHCQALRRPRHDRAV